MVRSRVMLATGAEGALGLELQKILPPGKTLIATSANAAGDRHLDITDFGEIQIRLREHNPDIVFHLAAIVPIPQIEKDPDRAFLVNVLGLNNLLRAVEAFNPKCKVIVLSSSEVYGNGMSGRKFRESDHFDPNNFYAFTKVSQEQLALLYIKRGLNIRIARIFNYSSIYKKPIYSLESFASQIFSIIQHGKDRKISVGNLEPERDFLQGEDVATALYHIAAAENDQSTYNVCRGETTSMFALLQRIIGAFGTEIEIIVDPSKFRRIDNMYVCGDNSRLRALGWAPRISVDEMINRLVEHHKKAISI